MRMSLKVLNWKRAHVTRKVVTSISNLTVIIQYTLITGWHAANQRPRLPCSNQWKWEGYIDVTKQAQYHHSISDTTKRIREVIDDWLLIFCSHLSLVNFDLSQMHSYWAPARLINILPTMRIYLFFSCPHSPYAISVTLLLSAKMSSKD